MKYSIITINFNHREGLRKTIESVINQTYDDYEYIVIDGGSTDGSVEVIKEYTDKIDFWVSEPDKGIYNAMNKGILQAHGEYLNFMNSGDCFYHKGVLKSVLPYLDADLVTGKAYYNSGVHGFYNNDISMLDFFKGTLQHQATFFRKKIFNKNLYDEHCKIISDWKLFVQSLVFDNCSFRNMDIIVCEFEPGGISHRSKELVEEERKTAYTQLFPHRVIVDYMRWKEIDSPLSDLVAELNGSCGFLKLAKFILVFIIRIRKIYLSFRI